MTERLQDELLGQRRSSRTPTEAGIAARRAELLAQLTAEVASGAVAS